MRVVPSAVVRVMPGCWQRAAAGAALHPHAADFIRRTHGGSPAR